MFWISSNWILRNFPWNPSNQLGPPIRPLWIFQLQKAKTWYVTLMPPQQSDYSQSTLPMNIKQLWFITQSKPLIPVPNRRKSSHQFRCILQACFWQLPTSLASRSFQCLFRNYFPWEKSIWSSALWLGTQNGEDTCWQMSKITFWFTRPLTTNWCIVSDNTLVWSDSSYTLRKPEKLSVLQMPKTFSFGKS